MTRSPMPLEKPKRTRARHWMWRFVRLLLLFRSDRNLWKYRWHYLKARNEALESEARTLREKLKQTKKYLRDANRGAQTNALVAELAIRRRAKPNTNVQRRSGDEPASPSVLKPTDQPPAPERSL